MQQLPNNSYLPLKIVLVLATLAELVLYTSSHWFWHREFFAFLGVAAVDPAAMESTFVQSQLQLIGALVLGMAMLNLIVLRDPLRNRPVMLVILLVGAVCDGIFTMHAFNHTLPMKIVVFQCALLSFLVVAGTLAYPWKEASAQA